MGVCTQHQYRPTTDHTKKHAPTNKASTRARATTPPTAPGATPKQRGKTPTRPRRQPDGTNVSKRQPFTRTNDDTQPNQQRPTNKGSRMRALARAREPKHATATKGTTKVQPKTRARASDDMHPQATLRDRLSTFDGNFVPTSKASAKAERERTRECERPPRCSSTTTRTCLAV